jgi:5'-phosphate synthase pdxT subunit
MKVTIGILGIQGAVSEHVDIANKAIRSLGIKGSGITVRKLHELESVDALIMPGGESTTIAKLILKFGLHDRIVERSNEGMPIMGTCAGAILLAKEGGDEVKKTRTTLLGLMDMAVDRNAFGRQRESFERDIDVTGLADPFHAVFIRAPAIVKAWGKCRPIATLDDLIVAARQGNLLALAFHPELTDDLRFHNMLIEMI